MRLFLVVALAGCPSPPPKCITVDTSCTPSYPPTFHDVYVNTLAVSCATTGSCHTATFHAGGLSFADEATAYTGLLAAKSQIDSSRPRLVPGDPACSLVVVRTDSPGASYQMPPPAGAPIAPGERCAIIQWIGAGAGM